MDRIELVIRGERRGEKKRNKRWYEGIVKGWKGWEK